MTGQWLRGCLRVCRVPLMGVGVMAAAMGAAAAAAPTGVGFRRLGPDETGIRFIHRLSESMALTNTVVNNGSGVACGDIDGDGRVDLCFAALEGGNVLYRNLGGWRFEDVTASAGVAVSGQASTGVVFADAEGDGDLDLLVGGLGTGVRFFANDGHGRFTERPECGLLRHSAAMSMALADADGDGDLDLYVANYRTTTIMDQPGVRFAVRQVQGRLTVTRVDGVAAEGPEWEGRFVVGPNGALREAGEPDVYYRNEGGGRFAAVPWTDGTFLDEQGRPLVGPPRDWGLSVMFRDLDDDGDPDLYVCNDADSPDRLWINDGHGRFRAAPPFTLRHTSLSSMGVDVADVNRDGLDDLFVLDMLARRPGKRLTQLEKSRPTVPDPGDAGFRVQVPRNTLQVRRRDGTYAELAALAGLTAADWAWCPIFLDVDLDGYEDLLVANGFHREVEDIDTAERMRSEKASRRVPPREELAMRAWFPRWETPNVAFRNRGDLTFEEVGQAWGWADTGVSQGMALADLDGDGDLDVVMNNLHAAPGVYRNEATAPRVAVRLRGAGANTRGIGARIRVLGGAVPEQHQEIIAGGRYLSGDEALRTFAVGGTNDRVSIEVRWRAGTYSVLTNVAANQTCLVDESRAGPRTLRPAAAQPVASIGFEDLSPRLGHRHRAGPPDDPARSPLLLRRMSGMGPGLAWCDLDGNGLDDLLIASDAGDPVAVRLNLGADGFRAVELPPVDPVPSGDVTGLVAWSGEPGRVTLLLGFDAGPEAAPGPSVLQRDLFFGQAETSVVAGSGTGAGSWSVGPLAVADLDADGEPDLFAGGRWVPGRYPAPASSRVYRGMKGKFREDAESGTLLKDVGLVRGAVWTDLEGDGFADLVLACEWGPLKVFRNRGGRLSAWDPDVLVEGEAAPRRLSDWTGWWAGVGAGDFDGDGRLDLVAGNAGRNTRQEEFLRDELRIRHGDIDGNGTWDALESVWDPVGRLEIPLSDARAWRLAVPGAPVRFPSHQSYAEAGVARILGEAVGRTTELRVRVLDSVVLLNRGDRFEARRLPGAAQWSPVFGICVGDADGNGTEDLFLAQNFSGQTDDHGPSDAGQGLWLSGDGHGGFTAVEGAMSGVVVHGDQRGAALADVDGDARIDLATTQVGGETRLFRNLRARPGLRVRLEGPGANGPGIGAVLQVGAGETWGPAREIHAGAGYRSQDGLTPVLARPPGADRVRVRWPGGAVTTVPVPPDLDPKGFLVIRAGSGTGSEAR